MLVNRSPQEAGRFASEGYRVLDEVFDNITSSYRILCHHLHGVGEARYLEMRDRFFLGLQTEGEGDAQDSGYPWGDV